MSTPLTGPNQSSFNLPVAPAANAGNPLAELSSRVAATVSNKRHSSAGTTQSTKPRKAVRLSNASQPSNESSAPLRSTRSRQRLKIEDGANAQPPAAARSTRSNIRVKIEADASQPSNASPSPLGGPDPDVEILSFLRTQTKLESLREIVTLKRMIRNNAETVRTFLAHHQAFLAAHQTPFNREQEILQQTSFQQCLGSTSVQQCLEEKKQVVDLAIYTRAFVETPREDLSIPRNVLSASFEELELESKQPIPLPLSAAESKLFSLIMNTLPERFLSIPIEPVDSDEPAPMRLTDLGDLNSWG